MTQAVRQFGLALGAIALSLVLVLGSLMLSLIEGGTGLALATPPGLVVTPVLQASQTPTLFATQVPGEPTFTPQPSPTNTLAPTPTPGCPLPEGWMQVSVQVGDTLESLAAESQTTVQVLLQANCLGSEQILPGMQLYLPAPAPAEQVSAPTAAPTVKCGPPRNWVTIVLSPGDNLYQLSRTYGVTVQELQLANCLGRSINITAGDKFYVPFAIIPTSTPTPTRTPTATVTRTPVTPTATVTRTPETPTATVTRKPIMTVVKSSATSSLSTPVLVTYSYLVSNTGNVTLTGISLSDNNASAMTCPATTLAVGASITCTATHDFTQAELDAGGTLDNVVTASSKEAPNATDNLSIPITQTPALTVVKSSATSSLSAPVLVTYSYLVTNTGNVTLTGISLSDNNASAMTCPDTRLAVGASITCTATHDFTQAELDAGGTLDNVVTASSKEAPNATDNLSIPITQTPALTVVKSSATSSLSAPVLVTYSYLVTNTGNVTLTGIKLKDDNANAMTCSDTRLAVGVSMTCTATHNFTQAELNANGSPVAGSMILYNVVTASSNEAPDATDDLSIPITQN